jgi:hypothetical protein
MMTPEIVISAAVDCGLVIDYEQASRIAAEIDADLAYDLDFCDLCDMPEERFILWRGERENVTEDEMERSRR